METVTDFTFLGFKITMDGDRQPRNSKTFAPWKINYDEATQHIKKQRQNFADKGMPSQSYGFSSSHVQMRELNHREI